MIEKLTVKLTIGDETRNADALLIRFPYMTRVEVAAMVMTTKGNKLHFGRLSFEPNEANEYDVKNVRRIGYHGMRGNGHGSRSSFRYIGFEQLGGV